ncbi:MAG: bifunctional (p)ppGpp synthetase/guanosine-3',5'-bis(diphosphate) 3'-pyrophosphohydrolase [Planctomycetota bacterium]|nr:MAG: bifunctional (p)ppGpp synthetase/guanosine-3',5'-bis(diphosphate) 3'-pyrophosphohydrolase [Planctomycetota bacterium]
MKKKKDWTLLEKALDIACRAHFGVKDKSGKPYILHPLRQAMRFDDEKLQALALLHDIVEDSEFTLDDLRKEGIPEDVLLALDCLTHRDGESYEDYIQRVESNPMAVEVKITDLEDNMDVRRLPGFEQKDMERMKKYLKYWRRLKNGKK